MRKLLISLITVFLFGSCTHKETKERNGVITGIDISQYQGNIDWEKVSSQKKHKIRFVIIRATAGIKKDKMFEKNFREAKKRDFVVGSYHYYDPNINSKKQAENYIKTIKKVLSPGDFLPVLDIEKYSKVQDKKKLVKGLKNFLFILEKEFGVKPIIYTGFSFFKDYLSEHFFDDYPLWIAAYSKNKRSHPVVKKAAIHQFSEKLRVPGIDENTVDGNDIKAEIFNSLVLK
ncbi:hypothetical protein IT402_00690 [Candidatus Nomurabacteria bacterium]|nr:hypothetical protein [Candidatus Nomurabacteria bacterium]